VPALVVRLNPLRNVARIERSEIWATKERNSEVERRQTQVWVVIRATRTRVTTRLRFGRGSLVGVPPRLWLRRPNATTQLQFRASRAGAFKRALPANRPATVQRCFSQTGRNAGRAEFPKTARERIASPPAGTALAPRYGLPATARPIDGRDSAVYVTESVTVVNRTASLSPGGRADSLTLRTASRHCRGRCARDRRRRPEAAPGRRAPGSWTDRDGRRRT